MDLQLHSVLNSVFGALDEAGIRWCLLRVPANPSRPSGDVDLLIDPADAARVPSALEPLGFVSIPGWERPPNLLLLMFDRPTNQWLRLDVLTELAYGPHLEFQTGAEAGCLARRERFGSMVVLAADDAFWALLLHCLLDKRVVAPHYQARLQGWAAEARADGTLARVVLGACTAECSPASLLAWVQAGDWDALERAGPVLAAAWGRRQPAAARVRAVARRWQRLARRPFLVLRRRGLSVALLGPNGVGKSTLAATLPESFSLPARSIYMGLWRSGPGLRLAAPGLAAAVRPLAIWRRYLTALVHQAHGRLVIFDRYTLDALQPPRPPLVGLKRPYFWLLVHACPWPDLVFVLDAPSEVIYGRKAEQTPQEVEDERRTYLTLPQRRPAIQVVDANRPREAVCADVTDRIWQDYAARWRRN